MDILINNQADLYIGGHGFQSSIFLMQIERRLMDQGRASETRLASDFDDALKEGVQSVIITDEGLVEGIVTLRYENGEEVKLPEKDVEQHVVGALTGKIIVFCEEDDEDAEIEDSEEFDD
ncbi:MAG: hypothetical protein AB1Z19_03970 [Eubacteriales bacterium]